MRPFSRLESEAKAQAILGDFFLSDPEAAKSIRPCFHVEISEVHFSLVTCLKIEHNAFFMRRPFHAVLLFFHGVCILC